MTKPEPLPHEHLDFETVMEHADKSVVDRFRLPPERRAMTTEPSAATLTASIERLRKRLDEWPDTQHWCCDPVMVPRHDLVALLDGYGAAHFDQKQVEALILARTAMLEYDLRTARHAQQQAEALMAAVVKATDILKDECYPREEYAGDEVVCADPANLLRLYMAVAALAAAERDASSAGEGSDDGPVR